MAVAEGAIGLVLAAGVGSRFGMPKAMARDARGTPWLQLTCRALVDGGCSEAVVVLGSFAEAAMHLAPTDARVVVAREWSRGQSASLAEGLAFCDSTDAAVAVVTLVDLPELSSDAVMRILGKNPDPGDLRRATYDGRPGHPVVLGRSHWSPLREGLTGDIGARTYLESHRAAAVDCTDLGGGSDVDGPPVASAAG